MSADGEDLGFAYRATKDGEIVIRRAGRTVTVLRGAAARNFAAEVAGRDAADAQQVMARVTGNYKRGNERAAAGHPRNRRPDEH
ncbi:MAG: hypothetical protein ABI593_17750 [Betaproteobacteria bacterium]